MNSAEFILDKLDRETLEREVGAKYGLGYISTAENMEPTFRVTQYNHVIFHGQQKDMSAMVIVTPYMTDQFLVKVFPKEMY